MSDQTLAQNSAVRSRFVLIPSGFKGALRKIKRVWTFGLCSSKYLLAGRRRGVSELVDFVMEDHPFSANQVPSELSDLGEILVRRRLECAVEIGTARGGTLFFLTRLASPQATIVSVDLPGGKFGGGYGPGRRWFYQRFSMRGQSLHLLQGDSHSSEMLARVKTAVGDRPLDYLFIDGDHSYEGVKRDFEMYSPLVREGGLIAFHDIVDGPPDGVGGVPRFWAEIKSHYLHTEFIRDRKQGGLGIGVIFIGERTGFEFTRGGGTRETMYFCGHKHS